MVFHARSRLVRFLGSLNVPASLLPPVDLLMSFGMNFMDLGFRLRSDGYGCVSKGEARGGNNMMAINVECVSWGEVSNSMGGEL